jgi:Fructose-1,6-bisphosphatase
MLGHFVAGGCRGSHIMPLMPVPINTTVAGRYCVPIVSCLAFSMDAAGAFTKKLTDVFGNVVWDATRLKVQRKADEWRRQGFVGPTMAAHSELAYTGIVDTSAELEKEFTLRQEPRLTAATELWNDCLPPIVGVFMRGHNRPPARWRLTADVCAPSANKTTISATRC